MFQFRSFEEGLAIIGATVVVLLTYKLFKASLLISIVIGGLTGLVIAYMTFFELTLRNGMIIYRNRFIERSFPLSHVKKVGMQTFWAGLPGHFFVFILRKPPAEFDGYWRRTGLISWPSASKWVDAVNATIKASEKQQPSHRNP